MTQMRAIDGQRHVAWYHFLFVLLPIAVFVTNNALVSQFGVSDLPLDGSVVRPDVPHLEAAGRTRFITAFWLFSVLVLIALAVFVDDLTRAMTWRTRAMAIGAWLLVTVPVVESVLRHQADTEMRRVFHLLGAEIYDAALGQGRLAGCTLPTDRYLLGRCGENPVLQLLRDVLDVVNILSALGVGALAVGMVLCLRDLPARAELGEARLALLQRNRDQMRKHLYLSGLLLTSGTFFAISWMHWPLAMIESDVQGEYRAVVRSVELLMGTYFSLLILSFYVPVAFVLERRVRAMARDATGDSVGENERRSWLREHGLATGQDTMLKEGLAVIAPILTAVAGAFAPLA